MAPEFRTPQTDEEWSAYHAIRERVLWTSRGVTGYDRHHPDEQAEGHYPLLYIAEGTPLGVVRVDLDGGTATLRRVAVQEDVQRRGHGRELLRLAEAFARSRGATLVRSNVNEAALEFYRKAGYESSGPPRPDGTLPMVKALAA
jgi:GNAT superfamily N-acetyltransferase